jgi:cytochrome oxidase Cu insertion factor (SCO1/SenC/PrrC family)
VPGAIALAATLAAGAFWLAREDFTPPPVYGEIPEFSLVNERGVAVGRQILLGHLWVANTIFTRCEDTCPLQTDALVRMQKEFPGEPRFLAVSIDPKRDTPAALAEYAKKHGTDPERWVFLTGGEKALGNLVRQGFRLPTHLSSRGVGSFLARLAGAARLGGLFSPSAAWAHHPQKNSSGAAGGGDEIIHSSRFLLLDRRARVRGYYRSNEEESLQKLRKDLRALLSEK